MGVILFARNLGTPDEIAALTRALHDAAPADGPPIVVSVDQEGGRVQRIKAPLTRVAADGARRRRGDLALTEAVGRAMALEVAALGFNVDYAPVLDVHTNPANPIIGDRAFGTDAARRRRAGARLLARPRVGGRARLRQALPRPRRHRDRLAPRAAARRRRRARGCAQVELRRSPPPPRRACPCS